MGQVTGISWTDHTFNPWWGCTKVSSGCDNCYADTFDKRTGGAHWGKGVPRREFGDKHWNEPLKWNREAEKQGVKHKVFCASMADVMDDEAPIGTRERLWGLIDDTPWLTWQLLTKRPHRYERYLPARFKHNNVWFGTSAENQEFYDVRWPILAAIRIRYMAPAWISYEPALGPITLQHNAHRLDVGVPDWIIFGGESGAGRRPMEQSWADNLKAECAEVGTKFFMKQFGARTPTEGKKLVPIHLQVQEFPA
jgi:protein gp37